MDVANIVAGPFLFNQSNTGITILWVTDLGGGPNAIEYSYPGVAATQKIAAVQTIQNDTTGETLFSNRVDLKDLPEGTLVNYNILAENFFSTAVYTFKTLASSSDVTLGVWGNNAGNFSSSTPGLADTLTGIGSVDGYLCTGGVTDNFEDYETWASGFYAASGSSFSTTPVNATRASSEPFAGLGRYLYPVPTYASWSIGPIQVVSLDTASTAGRRGLSPGKPQYEWFTQVATNSPAWKEAKYRVLMTHNAPRTNLWSPDKSFGNGAGVDSELDQLLTPLIRLSGADLCLFGMSKSYQRGSVDSTRPENPGSSYYVITGGGGGFKHNIFVNDFGPPKIPNIVEESSSYHFLKLQATSSSLEVTAISLEFVSTIDSFTIAPRTLI